MAQPSSERERDRDRERDRERRHSSSGHHHHRTISSTTLLLALSLILAVLAITLTIPSYSSSSAAAQQPAENAGLWGYLTPKRAQGLLAREGAVAMREAEVARREAELLAGSPVGIAVPPPAQSALPAGCPPGTLSIVTATQTVTVEYMPTGAVVREVVSEVNAIGAAPHQFDPRVDNLLDRERGVSVREKDVGNREETVGKREQDASRRESWIMEQLVKLGNDKVVEEEIVYDGRDGRDGRQDSRDRRDTRDVPPQRKKVPPPRAF